MPKRVPDEAIIIGQNIRRLRKSLGFTQLQMGEALAVSFQQLQKYECGHNRLPVEKLYLLHHIFDTPYEYFFENMTPVPSARMRSSPYKRVQERLQTLKDPAILRKIEKIIEILLS